MRSSGGDESIPKFATFDDRIRATPLTKNTRKELNTSVSPLPPVPSTGQEQSRTEAWSSTFKDFIGRSTSATNLLSRLKLNEDEEMNDSSKPSVNNKQQSRIPQDRHALTSSLANENGLTSNVFHENPNKKPRDGNKKSTTFVSSDDVDREDILLKQHYASKKCTFQNFSERMAVSVRVVDLSNRVAFARVPLPTGSQIRAYADELVRSKGLKGESSETVLAKLSPSPQYVDVLNTWRRVSSIRQLCWSPSVSREADPFYGWSDDDDDARDTVKNEPLPKKSSTAQNRLDRRRQLTRRRRRNQARKDGRYLQIDTVAYIKETLPDSCPHLSYRKRRLPMRTDVGFDGATEQEIAMKEDEIRQEALLEEISPRIIVLLTSDLVSASSNKHKDEEETVHPDVLESLIYRVPGIPFAGKELAMAKQRNLKARCYNAQPKTTAGNDVSIKTGLNTQAKASTASASQLKPNQFSVFSPPLDASISSSQLWKPRPFFDRPSGFVHLLAVPVDVKFDIGDIEPLVCTLTLYSLPGKIEKQGIQYCQGKISEDFIFPAGNWNGIVSGSGNDVTKQMGFDTMGEKHTTGLKDVHVKNGQPNEQPWRRRTNKALFSFNPLDLPPSPNDEFPSLYFVLQVYQLIRKDAPIPYLHDDSPRKMSMKGNRVIDAFSGSRKRFGSFESFDEGSRNIDSGISSLFKTYGTQLLTPLCFGLLPAFPSTVSESIPREINLTSSKVSWPNGASQSMQLFAYPACPESHEDFVDRLFLLSSHITHPVSTTTGYHGTGSTNTTRLSSDNIEEHDEGFEFFDRTPSNRLTGNVNTTKKRSPFIPFVRSKPQADIICGNETVCGKAFLFTSLVESDFSQVMLQQPRLFEQESLNPMPRLLVNISGDGAIMAQPAIDGDIVKRSSLLRLPISGDASGYAESSEIREILYMPSFHDQADLASVITQRSFTDTNLLYIYPQLIKQTNSQKAEGQTRSRYFTYALEIGLVQQGSSLPQNFYNPAPGHKPLISSVYTKIPPPLGRDGSVDIRKGIYLRDEVKMKLPVILDDSYSLVFAVHAINLNSDNDNDLLEVSKVADALYPLCASSNISGKSVFTIISDGLHHAHVGNFQVTFEVRLASNIHTSNPSIAAAMNICPSIDETKLFVRGITSFCDQWSRLSEVTRSDHFYAWAYYFLSGCVALASDEIQAQSNAGMHFKYRDVMLELMRSLLSLTGVLRTNLIHCGTDVGKSGTVVKAFIDDFDDSSILYYLGDEVGGQSGTASNIKSIDLSPDDDLDEKIPIERDESSNAKVRKSVRYSTDQSMLKYKTLNSTKQAGTFRRIAYGTSKSDRMKAEAALHESSLTFSQLMDDEETIFTTGTWQTGLRSSMNPHSTKYNIKTDDQYQRKSDNPAVEAFSEKLTFTPPSHHDHSRSVRKTMSVVDQVHSVAQTLIIPCVFPALSSGSPTSKSIRHSKSNVINDKAQKLAINHHHKIELPMTVSRTYAPSSDIEDETFFSKRNDIGDAFIPDTSVPLRGLGNWIIISSSFSESIETKVRPYLYEVIFILWRETWLEAKSGNAFHRQMFGAFIDNCDFLIPLCLKSLILRCSEISQSPNLIPSILFDRNHINILSSLVEATSYGLMDEILKGSCQRDFDHALVKCLSSNDLIIDFLTGLLAVIHPAQVSWLISKYFDGLRVCDTNNDECFDVNIIKSAVVRLRGSRLLRLRATERISSLPRFLALNFPLKPSSSNSQVPAAYLSWTSQIKIISQHLDFSDTADVMNGLHRLPESNWLAGLVVDECFTICAKSTLSLSTLSASPSLTKKRNSDFPSNIAIHCHQSMALHSITIIYELLLRSHATDRRYQNEEASYRVASVFLAPILDHSIDNMRALVEMNADDTTRILWLSTVLYVLQESAESSLCNLLERIDLSSICHILRLCNETFQCFMTVNCSPFAVTHDVKSTPILLWLAQESYNTISASIILLINESCRILTKPIERTSKAKTILDLLIYLLSIPQSPVTLLRILGAVSHMIDKFGGSAVIEAMDDSLQNWGRVILTLMNCTSLSVRSMAVDLILSLFCSAHKKGCDFHQIILVFLTVLPEVAAREIGLYSVSGLINDGRSIEQSVWPIRRAIADIEACDPSDDDRLDAAFVPSLRHFCRSSQAIIDGVLIELRLKGSRVSIAGTKVSMTDETTKSWPLSWTFDADEESLLEAANSFDPETGCMQRLRWLLLLRLLHERKGNWIESGETLVLCALDISQSIPHAKKCWLPSRFDLWYDSRLATIESNMPCNDWHSKLIEFFEPFLLNVETSSIPRPNIKSMCKLLTSVIKEIVKKFEHEANVEALALLRIEQLIKVIMNVIEDHASHTSAPSLHSSLRPGAFDDELVKSYNEAIEENAALRQVSSALNEMVNKLSGNLFISSRKEENIVQESPLSPSISTDRNVFYVQFLVCGFMPDRFKESTTIPTFNTFNIPHVCRVPKSVVSQVLGSDTAKKARALSNDSQLFLEEAICREFAQVYIKALKDHSPNLDVVFCTDAPDEYSPDYHSRTYISVRCLSSFPSSAGLDANDGFDRYLSARSGEAKKFYFEKRKPTKSTVEITVPRKFPFVLSRQPILMSMEFISSLEN